MECNEWNRVIKQWNAEFPFLKRFGNSALFFRTDIMLIGLRFDRIYDSYRPMIEAIPLWNSHDNWKKSFLFRNAIYKNSNSNLMIDIDYDLHERYFQPSVRIIKEQFGDLLSGELSYADLISLEYQNYKRYERVKRSMFKLSHFEYCLILAEYFNNYLNINKILSEVENTYKRWNNDTKKIEYLKLIGFSLDNWRQEIYEYYANREAFFNVCHSNSLDKSVKSLNYAAIIDDPPIIKTSVWTKFTNIIRRLLMA